MTRVDLAPQTAAAAEVFVALAEIGRKGCLIGGLALQRWGEPRFTQDADLTALTPLGSEALLMDALLQRFSARMPTARQHAIERRVLLLTASNGVSLDISLAALPFEEEGWTGRRVGGRSVLSGSTRTRIRHWGAQFAELKEDADLLRPFEDALTGPARPGGSPGLRRGRRAQQRLAELVGGGKPIVR